MLGKNIGELMWARLLSLYPDSLAIVYYLNTK
jgi:hypothetical protein